MTAVKTASSRMRTTKLLIKKFLNLDNGIVTETALVCQVRETCDDILMSDDRFPNRAIATVADYQLRCFPFFSLGRKLRQKGPLPIQKLDTTEHEPCFGICSLLLCFCIPRIQQFFQPKKMSRDRRSSRMRQGSLPLNDRIPILQRNSGPLELSVFL